jgi:hypothetical protein
MKQIKQIDRKIERKDRKDRKKATKTPNMWLTDSSNQEINWVK